MNKNEELMQIARQIDKTNPTEGDINEFKFNPVGSIHVKNNFLVDPDPNNFENLVKSSIFVDKSLFIKQVFDSDSRSVVITRPRR